MLIFCSAGNWQEVLRTHIEPDQLPVAYGGNLTDPDGDPRCRTMVRGKRGVCEHRLVLPWITTGLSSLQIKYGGTVPKSYYVQDSVKVRYDNSVTISRGSVFQLEYDVKVPSSLLRYSPRSARRGKNHLLVDQTATFQAHLLITEPCGLKWA